MGTISDPEMVSPSMVSRNKGRQARRRDCSSAVRRTYKIAQRGWREGRENTGGLAGPKRYVGYENALPWPPAGRGWETAAGLQGSRSQVKAARTPGTVAR